MSENILAVNAGSSSIKFSLFEKKQELIPLLKGVIRRIASKEAEISIMHTDGKALKDPVVAGTFSEAVHVLVEFLDKSHFESVTAIGHRIVHGMSHAQAEIITDQLITELKGTMALDPDHVPGELQIIQALRRKYPSLPHVACFDTAFHATIPAQFTILPLPRRYLKSGLRRYGFHGISYSYLMHKLTIEDNVHINGRIIMAHLGNGASMAAIKNGKSVDTSMGFTPAGGFPMSTRSGDIDPGIVSFIMQSESLSAGQFNDLVNHQSGLLGISETSGDVETLIGICESDSRAADAIDIFCYQVKKWIGSFAAALGGLDLLVFSGGIGENAPLIRKKICAGLQFLGIELDDDLNQQSLKVISAERSKTQVYVLSTDEEWMIAKTVVDVLSIK